MKELAASYKIEIFIPEAYIGALQEGLQCVGAGRIGNYDSCMSIMKVRGYWRPLEGANPFDGEVGKLSAGEECKVEVNCAAELVKEALRAIREVHPYEEPLINVIPLANEVFE